LLDLVRGSQTVALYAPLGTEVDVLELVRRLEGRDVTVLFPRAVPGDRRMRFAACAPAELVAGPLGAREPPPTSPAVDEREIDCVVLPGLAFSLDGHRLGRGGGYYDATLPTLSRAARVGVAFEPQLVASLPHEAHDATLDALVTEARTLRFSRETG
jgi:5-formyltetrahydrofolate cyclo-ligase